jgi:hypothetical protein
MILRKPRLPAQQRLHRPAEAAIAVLTLNLSASAGIRCCPFHKSPPAQKSSLFEGDAP